MVTIGGINETIYTISKYGEIKVTMTEENTTGCDDYKQYWIRWDDGLVEVGEGSVGNVPGIVMWKHPQPISVMDIAIFSGNSSGSWIFPTPGKLLLRTWCMFISCETL